METKIPIKKGQIRMVTLASAVMTKPEREIKVEIKNMRLERLRAWSRILKVSFVDPVLNYVFTPQFVNFFKRISRGNQILEHLEAGPGSWKSMLAHYDSKPKSAVDYIVNNLISFPAGLRNRQKLVREALKQLIHVYRHDRPLSIVAVGCGSGNNILPAIKERNSEISPLRAQLFDLNNEAMEFGRVRSREMGLEHEVSFIQSDANQIERMINIPPQIVEMIGLVEYLSDEDMIRLFESVSRFRDQKRSSILISSIEPKHGIDRFLRRTLDFNLNYRSPEILIPLLSRVGYKKFDVFPEPTGIFNILVGHTN